MLVVRSWRGKRAYPSCPGADSWRRYEALAQSLHLNLDDAWPGDVDGLRTLEAKRWGPSLRFAAPVSVIENFYVELKRQLAPFILYGSGDFHHLTALWLRRFTEPLVVVSFDNHPDWDLRPPRWCCGGWVNRALELPQVRKVSVWGCGNFECWWPGQFFGNRRAERRGELEVHAWADDRPAAQQQRRGAILRTTWREKFEQFLTGLAGHAIYVTVDLDCLQVGDAITNWENGKFTVEDVAWALGRLRSEHSIVGGDICGAFSKPRYARLKQRFVATIDHPKLPVPGEKEARDVNCTALKKLWPILAQ